MLYRRKIIVMDEPTASVDVATDGRIQPLIRQVTLLLCLSLCVCGRVCVVCARLRALHSLPQPGSRIQS